MEKYMIGDMIRYNGNIPQWISSYTKEMMESLLILYRLYEIKRIIHSYNNRPYNDWVILKEIYPSIWLPLESFCTYKNIMRRKYSLI